VLKRGLQLLLAARLTTGTLWEKCLLTRLTRQSTIFATEAPRRPLGCPDSSCRSCVMVEPNMRLVSACWHWIPLTVRVILTGLAVLLCGALCWSAVTFGCLSSLHPFHGLLDPSRFSSAVSSFGDIGAIWVARGGHEAPR
jgi:hypothetical protein